MTLFALIEALATLLWVYAALTAFSRATLGQRVGSPRPRLSDRPGDVVPVLILLVVATLLGALIGAPRVIWLGAVLVPAGLIFVLHRSLAKMSGDTEWPGFALRLGLTIVLGAAIIWLRQIA